MSRVQIAAVALTVLLSALDGYDVLSVTFAAPAIFNAWHIGKAELGVVLGSGLAGMAAGSFLLAPLADVVGRRKMVLVSLVLMAVGSLCSAFSLGVVQLAAWRVLTGLGIGTCIAVINPLAAEFSNARRRPLAVSLMALGYPAGGLIGGLIAAVLLRSFGWPAVFIGGFAAAVLLIPVTMIILPESPAYLVARRSPGHLAQLNALLVRCGQPKIAQMPSASLSPRGYAGVFAAAQRGTTLRLALVNLLGAACAYYVLSWLPQMISDAGFSPSQGSLASALSSLVGIVGGVLLGWLANRVGLKRLTLTAMIGFGLSTAALGVAPPSLPLLMLAAAASGFFLFSGAAGLYAVLGLSFPDETRATGSGFVIGVGRVSSAAAPLIAGWMFASGLDRAEVCAAFGGCQLLAAAVLFTHRIKEDAA